MLKKNVLLVVNPVSGGFDKDEFVEATRDFINNNDFNLVVYRTTGHDDVVGIQNMYETSQPYRIIVAGGDGTLKLVGEAMAGKDIICGILPVGSSNGLAVELDLIKTLDENLEIALRHDYVEIDIVLINGKKSLHLSDIGLNAELIKNYKKSKVHGKWGYALQVFRTLLHAKKPFRVHITASNKVVDCEARMIVMANAKKYGTGVVINPLGILNDGKFELVIVKKMNLLIFCKIMMGIKMKKENEIEIISTNLAVIKTSFPVNFQIDGEFMGTENELNVSIATEKIKVAVF
ncbi:diacylglycerol/lipid kinase family protein [Flavobacterium sp. 7A]|uniref:diacylglycerol/lipid kinase family protein n=1 Tax=Flavobacterium sp. 7A TaxID=2940571 RepID=UPI0029CAC190|nr:diacylglycerol kinase family protein [Flavobacterium sp. 7A]MCW2119062.1 diacylglycerol kinase family enzyme [Flavobacterium sp. 7A]